MALNADILKQDILLTLRKNIRAKYKKAKPMPFQEIMAEAIAKGIIDSVKSGSAMGLLPTKMVAPPIVYGIKGISGDLCRETAKLFYRQQIGSVGETIDIILDSIFGPLLTHLEKFVEIVPVSGFGGPLPKILNITAEVTYRNILDNLPAKSRSQIEKSRAGGLLFKAVAEGFAKQITATGFAKDLPEMPDDDPVGIAIAGFK
jgi:hypothetical protein